jgi:hypothetical protein
VSDWIGLGVLLACIAAVFLARRRSRQQVASAIAAVRIEGFEAGKAAVLASIGSTVVVNNQVGNGSAGFDSAGYLDDEHHRSTLDDDDAFAVLRRGDHHEPSVLPGVPVDVHPRDFDGDPRAIRAAALNEHPGVTRISANGNSTPYYDVSGRGPGQ